MGKLGGLIVLGVLFCVFVRVLLFNTIIHFNPLALTLLLERRFALPLGRHEWLEADLTCTWLVFALLVVLHVVVVGMELNELLYLGLLIQGHVGVQALVDLVLHLRALSRLQALRDRAQTQCLRVALL